MDLNGQEVTGISSLRVFINFTPLGGPTALQYAFAESTPLTSAQAASAPSLTSLGPNAVVAKPAAPLPTNVSTGIPGRVMEKDGTAFQPKRVKSEVPSLQAPSNSGVGYTGVQPYFRRQNF